MIDCQRNAPICIFLDNLASHNTWYARRWSLDRSGKAHEQSVFRLQKRAGGQWRGRRDWKKLQRPYRHGVAYYLSYLVGVEQRAAWVSIPARQLSLGLQCNCFVYCREAWGVCVCACVQLKTLNHENVKSFIGASIEPGHICCVMQYCNRGTVQVSFFTSNPCVVGLIFKHCINRNKFSTSIAKSARE